MVIKKERIFYYDVLRAIAIIAVICCHVGRYANPSNVGLIKVPFVTLHYFGLVGVPIFFMISGALLLNREYTLSDFFKRRFSRIIYPFIFWVSLIMIFGLFYFNWSYAHAWKVFTGNPSILWYIWALIGVYLFIPVINSFLREYGLKGLEYFLIIWFFTIILKSMDSYPLLPYLDLNYFTSFIGYVILGYYLDNKKFNLKDSTICIIGVVVFLISLITIVVGIMKLGYHMLPFYENVLHVTLGVGLFLLIKYLGNFNFFNNVKNRVVGKIIISISMCSYGMYYAHYLINQFFKSMHIHSNKLFFVILFLLIILSWILTILISKIPILKKFSGV